MSNDAEQALVNSIAVGVDSRVFACRPTDLLPQFIACKLAADNTVIQCNTADVDANVLGVAATTRRIGEPSSITILRDPSRGFPALSAGGTPIAVGDRVGLSTVTPGRFVTNSAGSFRAISPAPATLDSIVYLLPLMSGGGAGAASNYFDVKAYGATGNGTTDDGPAIQAAFTAAALVGGTVLFPPVTSPATQGYKITTAVAVTMTFGAAIGLNVLGFGDHSPIIVAVGTGVDAITITTTALEWFTGSVKNLTFRTSNLSTAGVAKDCRNILRLAASSNEKWHIDDIKAVGVSTSGLELFSFGNGGGTYDIGTMHNAGCYASSAGAPVWAFVHFDQVGSFRIGGVSSFGEYNWFGAGNSVSGLGITDALIRVTPSRNASWGPTVGRIVELATSTRDAFALYHFQTSGVLRSASIIIDNAWINAGGTPSIAAYDIEKFELHGCTWNAGAAYNMVSGYQFGHIDIHNVTTPTGSTVPKILTDATGTIDIYDTVVGVVTGDTNGGVRQLRSGMGGGATGAALTVSTNVIAPTRPIHSVGAGLIKTITLPYAAFVGTLILRPTAAFTYDATGNILGTGIAVIGRDMNATYDGVKWAMSY